MGPRPADHRRARTSGPRATPSRTNLGPREQRPSTARRGRGREQSGTGLHRWRGAPALIRAEPPPARTKVSDTRQEPLDGAPVEDGRTPRPRPVHQSGEPFGTVAAVPQVHGRPADVQQAGGLGRAAAPVEREQDASSPRLTARRSRPSQPPFQGRPVLRDQLEALGRLHASDRTRFHRIVQTLHARTTSKTHRARGPWGRGRQTIGGRGPRGRGQHHRGRTSGRGNKDHRRRGADVGENRAELDFTAGGARRP